MKSAIFQNRQPPVRATQRGGTKRPHTQPSQAPIAPVPTPGTPALATSPTWTLGDLFANYIASGALPAPLSPTLPPEFEGRRFTPDYNEHEVDDSADSDADVLVSLISPAPPQRTRPRQPAPKLIKARTARSVRVVNRLADPDRPRLLVRINYRPRTKARRPEKSDESRSTSSTGSKVPEPKKNDVAPEDAEFRPRAAWAALIRELQAQGERASKSEFFFSLVVQLDAIMCSVVACEPDEHPKRSVAERNWLHVHASVPQFVTRIERHLKAHPISEKRKAMLSFLVANLAVVRALLLKRVMGLLLLQLRDDTDVNRAHDVQKRIIEFYQKMEDNFAQSQTFFSLSPPPATVFPQSWHNRASSIPRPVGLPLSPATDKYFLPLGIYSDLREAVAYLHSCVREFAEMLGPELNGDVRYNLQSGQKR